MAGIFKSKAFVFAGVVAVLVAMVSVIGFAMGNGAPKAETYSWRYKMTVAVDTPEGVKTGSSVREVDVEMQPRPGTRHPYHASVKLKGEAVVVDLGKRGVLFALMKGKKYGVDYGHEIVFGAFPYKGGLTINGVRHYSSLKTGKAVLTPEEYPMLVKFGDISDPKTVQIIDPENLVASFGPGVKLKDITIEMTTEPVTSNITSILPWLIIRAQQHTRGYLGGGATAPFEDPTKTYLTGSELLHGRFK